MTTFYSELNTGCGNNVTPIFCSFLSNRLEFQCQILPTYLVSLCAHISIIAMHIILLMYFEVIRITVTPPSDFSVLKTFIEKRSPENRMQNWL